MDICLQWKWDHGETERVKGREIVQEVCLLLRLLFLLLFPCILSKNDLCMPETQELFFFLFIIIYYFFFLHQKCISASIYVKWPSTQLHWIAWHSSAFWSLPGAEGPYLSLLLPRSSTRHSLGPESHVCTCENQGYGITAVKLGTGV